MPQTLPRVLSASTLTGDAVRNAKGDSLGKIEDLMLDLDRGQVAYAVLSFGGFLGVGDKLFAVPWKAMRLDTDKHEFILDIDEERLENAPGFDKNDWPSHADPAFLERIYAYYEVEPLYAS